MLLLYTTQVIGLFSEITALSNIEKLKIH